MGLDGFSQTDVLLFFASLSRVLALFLLLPIFGDQNVPTLVRIFLAFTVNLVVYPIAMSQGTASLAPLMASDMGIVVLVLKEAAVGIIIGFTAKIFFDAINFAFAHMGNQMGFSMASAYDHHTETSTPVISHMIMILAMLLFLAMNGHHFFLRALVDSYYSIPVGGFVMKKSIVLHVLETSGQVFWIGVKLSSPMALVIFLINCAFGIVAKAVPQINVLVVSFTVNILAGFLVITLTLPVFGTSMAEVIQMMVERVESVMKVLA
jgi:flagellar biosynthetic protein FliR